MVQLCPFSCSFERDLQSVGRNGNTGIGMAFGFSIAACQETSVSLGLTYRLVVIGAIGK